MTLERPDVTVHTGIYLFKWESLNIEAMVERIFEDSRHILSGELAIWQKAPGQEELLEQTRLNLSSSSSRDRLAKALAERVENIDWVSVIKYVCILTIKEYRKGEPVVQVGQEPASMETDYRLYPILEEGEPTTIYGPGGAGKSYLADYIAVLVQMNHPGTANWLPKSGNVLYLDWEASESIHNRRIWAIKKGLGITTNETVFYRFCTQPLAYDIIEIQHQILEHDIGLVIVDSQVAASSGDIERAEVASQYYNALRSLRRTSLTIDHVPKNVESGKAMPFGSVFKWNRSRSLFELKKYQEPGEDTIELGLYHVKHNEGRLIKPFGIRVEFDYEGKILQSVRFLATDIQEIPELIKGLSLKARIIGLLKSGEKMEVKEIAEIVEEEQSKVRARLNENKKTFKHFKDGWGLLSYEE